MILLSDLLEAEVLTEAGDSLGHVHDTRARRLQRRTSEGHRLRVVGLVIGGRGIRERLGVDTARTAGPIADRDLIEWERVIEVDGDRGRVVVRGRLG
jgi:sporulation protein YlmC with PRC-barrel domain